MSGPWVGIDPGPSWTGIAARFGTVLVAHRVVPNKLRVDAGKLGPKRDHGVGDAYLDAVLDAIAAVASEARDVGPGLRYAIEAAICPAPFNGGKKSFIPPRDILGLGVVYGAVTAVFHGAVVVQPGGNGSGLLASYPEGLITAGERRHGLMRPAPQSSELRHARSAWDVTLEAEKLARWQVLA